MRIARLSAGAAGLASLAGAVAVIGPPAGAEAAAPAAPALDCRNPELDAETFVTSGGREGYRSWWTSGTNNCRQRAVVYCTSLVGGSVTKYGEWHRASGFPNRSIAICPLNYPIRYDRTIQKAK